MSAEDADIDFLGDILRQVNQQRERETAETYVSRDPAILKAQVSEKHQGLPPQNSMPWGNFGPQKVMVGSSMASSNQGMTPPTSTSSSGKPQIHTQSNFDSNFNSGNSLVCVMKVGATFTNPFPTAYIAGSHVSETKTSQPVGTGAKTVPITAPQTKAQLQHERQWWGENKPKQQETSEATSKIAVTETKEQRAAKEWHAENSKRIQYYDDQLKHMLDDEPSTMKFWEIGFDYSFELELDYLKHKAHLPANYFGKGVWQSQPLPNVPKATPTVYVGGYAQTSNVRISQPAVENIHPPSDSGRIQATH